MAAKIGPKEAQRRQLREQSLKRSPRVKVVISPPGMAKAVAAALKGRRKP
jgi:hypothetical protein